MTAKKEKTLKKAVLREELAALTGDSLSALVLSQMLYWSERVRDHDAFLQEEQERRKNKNVGLQRGWIWKSSEQLRDELMECASARSIRRKLSGLVERGWLAERANPRHRWDRTKQYRADILRIHQDLEGLGYSLEGYPRLCEALDVAGQGDRSDRQDGRSDGQDGLPNGQPGRSGGLSVGAVPETVADTSVGTRSEDHDDDPSAGRGRHTSSGGRQEKREIHAQETPPDPRSAGSDDEKKGLDKRTVTEDQEDPESDPEPEEDDDLAWRFHWSEPSWSPERKISVIEQLKRAENKSGNSLYQLENARSIQTALNEAQEKLEDPENTFSWSKGADRWIAKRVRELVDSPYDEAKVSKKRERALIKACRARAQRRAVFVEDLVLKFYEAHKGQEGPIPGIEREHPLLRHPLLDEELEERDLNEVDSESTDFLLRALLIKTLGPARCCLGRFPEYAQHQIGTDSAIGYDRESYSSQEHVEYRSIAWNTCNFDLNIYAAGLAVAFSDRPVGSGMTLPRLAGLADELYGKAMNADDLSAFDFAAEFEALATQAGTVSGAVANPSTEAPVPEGKP